jgi:hypothetical protein
MFEKQQIVDGKRRRFGRFSHKSSISQVAKVSEEACFAPWTEKIFIEIFIAFISSSFRIATKKFYVTLSLLKN